MLKTQRHIDYYHGNMTHLPLNKGQHYTAEQVVIICEKKYTDAQLAAMFGRTLHGIEAVRKNHERALKATDAAFIPAPKVRKSKTFISEADFQAAMEAGEQ